MPAVWVTGGVAEPRVWVTGAVTEPRVWVSRGGDRAEGLGDRGGHDAGGLGHRWGGGDEGLGHRGGGGACLGGRRRGRCGRGWLERTAPLRSCSNPIRCRGERWGVRAARFVAGVVDDEMVGADEGSVLVVGVVETSTAGAAARTDLGTLDELVWGFVVDTETGEGLEGASAALGEGRVADALGVVVADVVGFVAGGGTRVVVADPVIVLAVPATSDVMDGGEVLTPRRR